MAKMDGWTSISKEDARKLSTGTASPGSYCAVDVSDFPGNLPNITNAASGYLADVIANQASSNGFTLRWGMAIAAVDEDTTKYYRFLIARDGSGECWFKGTDRHFPGHHAPPGPIDFDLIFEDLCYGNLL